jgi:hypothetical protein
VAIIILCDVIIRKNREAISFLKLIIHVSSLHRCI